MKENIYFFSFDFKRIKHVTKIKASACVEVIRFSSGSGFRSDTHFRFCFRGRSKVTVKMVEHDGVVDAVM